jgi:hypothetical protein
VSATGVLRSEGVRYALDNGAWTAFQAGKPFDEAKFRIALERLGEGADWVVCPDVVGKAADTLKMAEVWLPKLESYRVLVAVQDGMAPSDVRPWLGARCGIAVGGSTAWKEATARLWGEVSRSADCHLHVLRVNTARRIDLCHQAGAHSIDGTSASRYSKTLPLLDRAVRASAGDLSPFERGASVRARVRLGAPLEFQAGAGDFELDHDGDA